MGLWVIRENIVRGCPAQRGNNEPFPGEGCYSFLTDVLMTRIENKFYDTNIVSLFILKNPLGF
jgi:hypothetical protein